MGMELRGFQATLSKMCVVSGIGVHSGDPVSLVFHPAEANSGIRFKHVSSEGSSVIIPARAASVSCTAFCTAIGAGPVQISTIEHVMAAIFAMGIDNLLIEIDGPEVPVLDGSSAGFIEAFDEAGIEFQAAKRSYIRVLKPVRVEQGGSWAEFVPHDGTRFEVEIDFSSPVIGRQKYASEFSEDVFRRDLARARTFGFLKDVERLWAAGKALGSSLENSVVIGNDERVINPEGLRHAQEFVRHKTLDAVGDLALAGAQFLGCFRSYRGGHALNAQVLRKLLTTPQAFEVVEARQHKRAARGADLVEVAVPVYAPWML